MRRYGLLFWLIFIVAIVLGVLLGRIDSLRKELTRARQSVVIAQQQTQTQEGRIAQLSKEISLLSRKLEAAKTYQLLSYKLKSGDTLYGLFGHAWKKIVKTENAEYVKLPAGKNINFRGYTRRVKKGENFSKLFGRNWKRIAYLNGFCLQQANILPAGKILKIPAIL